MKAHVIHRSRIPALCLRLRPLKLRLPHALAHLLVLAPVFQLALRAAVHREATLRTRVVVVNSERRRARVAAKRWCALTFYVLLYRLAERLVVRPVLLLAPAPAVGDGAAAAAEGERRFRAEIAVGHDIMYVNERNQSAVRIRF